jgi:hypothetical protein
MKYITHITGWTIKLDNTYFYSIESLIRTNKPITPEVVGHLIGMAKSTIERSRCAFCAKHILESEVTTRFAENLLYPVPSICHQKCYDKDYEKWQKTHKEFKYDYE